MTTGVRTVQVRNKTVLPDLSKEGVLEKEIVVSTIEKHGVPVGSRLFSHHTLSSVRKLSFYHPFLNCHHCHSARLNETALNFLYKNEANEGWHSAPYVSFSSGELKSFLMKEKAMTQYLIKNGISYQCIPNDKLDLILTSTYNQSTERFADEVDLHLQPETRGCETWRKIRNTITKPVIADIIRQGKTLNRGGITERKSPFSVKLMNSGVHSSQTNPGYSRQPAGGAIFFY